MTTEEFRTLCQADLDAAILAYFDYKTDEWLSDGPTEAARVLSLWRYGPQDAPKLGGDADPAELANLPSFTMTRALVELFHRGDLVMGWETFEAMIDEFEERYADDGEEVVHIPMEAMTPAPRTPVVPSGVAAAEAVRAYVAGHLRAGEDAASEVLDEMVHNHKGDEAADINNGGLDAQVNYLIGRGETAETINTFLAEADEED